MLAALLVVATTSARESGLSHHGAAHPPPREVLGRWGLVAGGSQCAPVARQLRASEHSIRCPQCGEARTVDARQARRIRAGESDRRCPRCRTAAHIRVTEHEREWARTTLSRMTTAIGRS